MWPKYGAGIRKTINILTGSGIWLFPGKRDLPKIGHGMRDLCLGVCQECWKPLKTRINSKYQSKGSTYILHLLAFVEIRLFNVFFWERKAVFGKLVKNLGDAEFSWKRGGNAGSDPPPPLPDPVGSVFLLFPMKVVGAHAHSNRRKSPPPALSDSPAYLNVWYWPQYYMQIREIPKTKGTEIILKEKISHIIHLVLTSLLSILKTLYFIFSVF